MIKWTTTTLKDGTAMLQGTVEGFPDAADAVQIWMCLLSEIVPLNWHMEWTRLRVEFWADSNRVLIYRKRREIRLQEESGKSDL